MAKTLYRALLPSGRGVRFARMTTRDYLSIQQRVATKIGDAKDPGGGRAKALASVEIVATTLQAITLTPLSWAYKLAPEGEDDGAERAPEVDVDAMLDGADARKLWTPVTYADLTRKDGEHSFDALFEDFADFEAMLVLATGMSQKDPAKGQNLLGKVQAVTGG